MYTVSSLLIACGNLFALREVMQGLAAIIKESLEVDNSFHTSSSSIYAKCGGLQSFQCDEQFKYGT